MTGTSVRRWINKFRKMSNRKITMEKIDIVPLHVIGNWDCDVDQKKNVYQKIFLMYIVLFAI